MLNKLVKTTVALSLAATMAFAANGMRWNVSEGDTNSAFKGIVETDLEDIGMVPKDIHPGVNGFYRQFYEPKLTDDGKPNPKYDPNFVMNLDNLGFITIASESRLRELLLKAPELGGFSPLNYLIFKKKGENKTFVGTVAPETMLDIVKVKDPAVRAEFTKMIDDLSAVTDKGMGGKVQYSTFDKLPEDTMMNFELKIDTKGDVPGAMLKFQKKFEALFEKNDYIIAGFRDFGTFYSEEGTAFDRYDAYFVYSLCHFKFSYTIFNVGIKPEAGAFAPCSMYMYMDKGTNVLKIGMPNVTNWLVLADVKDPKMVKEIENMDKKIKSLMIELGAVEK